jgi:ribosomal-protein-alanine N-acetyltransferase
LTPFTYPDAPLTDGEIVLRPLVEADAPAHYAGTDDPLVKRFAFRRPFVDEADTRAWVRRLPGRMAAGEAIVFAVAAPGVELAGGVMLIRTDWEQRSSEVGFWLAAHARGQGVARRAVELLCPWAFTLGLERLSALCLPDNEAAHRVVERAGFRREGTLRGLERRHDGGRNDLVSFGRLVTDGGA